MLNKYEIQEIYFIQKTILLQYSVFQVTFNNNTFNLTDSIDISNTKNMTKVIEWWSFVKYFDSSFASLWDYGTYHIGDQWRLRRACASAQSRQSLCCLHTWLIDCCFTARQPKEAISCRIAHMKYGSRRMVWPKIRHLAPLDDCACSF